MGLDFQNLHDKASYCAKLLKNGKVIGWFQGRMEFGPRALGNRSILSAPYPNNKKNYINNTIKHREPFRPFAPAILEEKVNDLYKIKIRSPFMLIATFLKNKRDKNKISATLHNDLSARVQTVSKKSNEEFYNLIKCFDNLTGVPVLLNTSFNDKGEPMICDHLDALKSFYKTNLDYLCLNNFLIKNSEKNRKKIKKYFF